MRITQANNQALGAPVDRINILAREAAKALREIMLDPGFRPRPARGEDSVPPEKEAGKKEMAPTQRWIHAQWMYLRIRAAIAGLDVLFSIVGLVDFVLLHVWRQRGTYTPVWTGIGGEIEGQMKDMAKEFGVELDESVFEG
jgi:aarF domain-containing kinase